MDVRSLPGVNSERLAELFRDAEYALGNVRGGNYSGYDLYNGYVAWSIAQVRMLSTAVTPGTLDLLVTTPRYRMLVALDPATMANNLSALVELEISAQVTALQEAQAVVRSEATQHAGVDVLLVPDTHVYLHAIHSFDQIRWESLALAGQSHVRLLVPLLVIDELDRAKRSTAKVVEGSKEFVRDRARTTLRTLEGLFDDPAVPAALRSDTPDSPKVTIALLMDAPDHVRLPDADSEIVDQARTVADRSGASTSIVTHDTGMRLRARAAGLNVFKIPQG